MLTPHPLYSRDDHQLMYALRRPHLSSLVALVVSLTCSCSPPELEPQKKPKPAPTREYTVNLPPVVNLEGKLPPLKDRQGYFQVDGLLMQPRAHFDKAMTIKGYVVDKARCKERVGETCDKPYLWIARTPGDTENRLRVVDMERKALRRFTVGKQYLFEGTFSQTSKSGYMNSRGLLKLVKHKRVGR